jgi:hypothetical protein
MNYYSITADTYTTVLQESQSALAEGMGSVVPRLRPLADPSDTPHDGPTSASGPPRERRLAVKHQVRGWGAWGSNPEPTD